MTVTIPALEIKSTASVKAYGEIFERIGASTRVLREIFNIGYHGADYMVNDKIAFAFLGDKEMCDYPELMKVVFTDSESNPLPPLTTVAMFDDWTSAHLYVIVLSPGNNVVIYEVNPLAGDNFGGYGLRANGLLPFYRAVLGMSDEWVGANTADVVSAAKLFGLTFDNKTGMVILPATQPLHYFHILNLSLAHIKELMEESSPINPPAEQRLPDKPN